MLPSRCPPVHPTDSQANQQCRRTSPRTRPKARGRPRRRHSRLCIQGPRGADMWTSQPSERDCRCCLRWTKAWGRGDAQQTPREEALNGVGKRDAGQEHRYFGIKRYSLSQCPLSKTWCVMVLNRAYRVLSDDFTVSSQHWTEPSIKSCCLQF